MGIDKCFVDRIQKELFIMEKNGKLKKKFLLRNHHLFCFLGDESMAYSLPTGGVHLMLGTHKEAHIYMNTLLSPQINNQ